MNIGTTLSSNLKFSLPSMRSRLSFAKEFVKHTAHFCVHYRQTFRCLQLLSSNPILGQCVYLYPRLIRKVYRPYLTHTIQCQDRLNILHEHYSFILKHRLVSLVFRSIQTPIQLAIFTGKSGSRYSIQIRAIAALEHEGELVLQITQDNELLYSVAFSFFKLNRIPVVGIGCLQGLHATDGLARIRQATRDMHGLRPKKLMVLLVKQLAHSYGCKDAVLVSNKNRVARKAMRKGLVFADYDQFWREIGAVQRDDGDFQLPCENCHKPITEAVVSKKRSEARKRFALTEYIFHAVETTFASA